MSFLSFAAANSSKNPASNANGKTPLRNARAPDHQRRLLKLTARGGQPRACDFIECRGEMEANLKQKLNDDLRQSMRDRNATKTMTIRLLLSAIKYAEVKPATPIVLSDVDILGVIAKEIKQREESIAAYTLGKRQDLVDKESAEMAILKAYMPEQLSRDEILAEAQKTIAEVGAKGPSDKGKVMGKIVAKLKGRADGKAINDIVTELLSKM